MNDELKMNPEFEADCRRLLGDKRFVALTRFVWAQKVLGIPTDVNAVLWAEEADSLATALQDLMSVIESDDLIPEGVSYMKEARKALSRYHGEVASWLNEQQPEDRVMPQQR